MRKFFALTVSFTITLGLGLSVMAVNLVDVRSNSEGITGMQGTCEKLGSLAFNFDSATVLKDGDWWYADLPMGVTLCHSIDFAILGTCGNPVPVGGGGINGTINVAVDGGSLNRGFLTIQDTALDGVKGGIVVAGSSSIWFHVSGTASTNRVLIRVYDEDAATYTNPLCSDGSSYLTVNASTELQIKVFDSSTHNTADDPTGPWGYNDSDADGQFGEQGLADELGTTGGAGGNDWDNAYCATIDREGPNAFTANTVNVSINSGGISGANFLAFNPTNPQVAHVVAGYVAMESITCGNGECYVTMDELQGATLYSIRAVEAEVSAPGEITFPYSLLSFSVSCTTEDEFTLTLFLPTGIGINSYYMYGSTPDMPYPHWYEFLYDGQTGAEIDGNVITLHFIDGERGDDDLRKNGWVSNEGGPVTIEAHKVLYFPYLIATGEEETELGIINSKGYEVTGSISYYRKNGELISSSDISIGAKGKITISADTIPSDTASAIVSADGDLVGYARYGNSQGQRCACPASTHPGTSVSIPHVATDANWRTGLALFNTNDEDITVTTIYDSGIINVLNLGAYAQNFFWLNEAESVSSISATGSVSVMEIFESLVTEGDRAALLLKDRYLDALYVPAISYGSSDFTGVGFKNGYNDGTVSLFGHNGAGEVEEVSLGSLSSQSRMAINLSGILGNENLWAQIYGEPDFTTPFGAPLLHFQGLGVFGKDNTGKLGTINLNALRFKNGFIGIVSADPEPTFALLNPGTVDGALMVAAHQSDGEVLASRTIQIGAGNNMTGVVSDLFSGASLTDVTHIRIVSDVDIYGFETIYTGDRMEMLPILLLE